jgi:hypothetical protein
MTVKQLATALIGLGLGLLLGSCGPVAGFTADHWPHWAGGMPAGVPPRPGSPGYQEYIAHRQADAEPAPPAATTATPNANAPAAPAAAPIVAPMPAPATPQVDEGAEVKRGGLY